MVSLRQEKTPAREVPDDPDPPLPVPPPPPPPLPVPPPEIVTTVIEEDPEIEAFEARTAVTVTEGGVGGFAGAWYRPLGVMAPKVAFPAGMAFTSHMTVGSEAFCTVTVNCSVALVATWVEGAVT